MKLFISYPSEQRDLCERLRLALEAEGHEVFTDRAELKEGEPYHEALREAIDRAEGMIYLVTPRAVAPGSYALTELDFAQRQWRKPGGHVLPVLVEPTPIASIPPYLRAVTLLQPKGDVVAETVAAVDRMRKGWPIGAWLGVAAVLLCVAAGAGYLYRHQQWERGQQLQVQRELRAAREALAVEVAAASQLCNAGNHAAGWEQFGLIAVQHPGDAAVRSAREDCGMRWLREMHVSEKETFSALVGKVQPVLAQGWARSSGQRRADLRAHLGWADFLRSRDGVDAPDPVPQFKAAVQDDAGNVYAHTMWAHNLAWTTGRLDDEATKHFATAVKSSRERPWVRGMQFSAALSNGRLYVYMLVVANDMRLRNESIEQAERERIWRYVIDWSLIDANERAAVFAALPPTELLATFEWLFPAAQVSDEQRALWRFAHAVLQLNAGDKAIAQAALDTLEKDLAASGGQQRLRLAVDRVLVGQRRPG